MRVAGGYEASLRAARVMRGKVKSTAPLAEESEGRRRGTRTRICQGREGEGC